MIKEWKDILSVILIVLIILLLFVFELQLYKIVKNTTYQQEDVNRDGVVDIKDLLIVQKKILEQNKKEL